MAKVSLTANSRFTSGVKAELARQGRKQWWLAEKLYISNSAISQKLSNKNGWSLEDAVEVSQALGKTLEELLA